MADDMKRVTATIEELCSKLRSADEVLSSERPVSQQYLDEVQQWMNAANSAIAVTDQSIAQMQPGSAASHSQLIGCYRSVVASFYAVEKEVRYKLHKNAVKGSADSYAVYMTDPANNVPPPSYAVATGEAPSAPTAQLLADPTPCDIYPRQQQVIYVTGAPNMQPVPFPVSRPRSRCTCCRISIYVLLIILKIIIIIAIVNRHHYSKPYQFTVETPSQQIDLHQDDYMRDYINRQHELKKIEQNLQKLQNHKDFGRTWLGDDGNMNFGTPQSVEDE